MPTTTRKSRVFTISLPAEMAEKVVAIAKLESRTISELFREAFRTYEQDPIRKLIRETANLASSTNPHGYTEEDIPRLVKEVRAEMRAERLANEEESRQILTAQ